MLKFVVLSPHRDDAAFSLGLSIESWLSSGHEVSVLNFFTKSAYAPYSDVEALHPNDRVSFVSAVRRKEDVAWGKLFVRGLSMQDFDLLDAPLRLACAVDDVQTVDVRQGDRAMARVGGIITKTISREAGKSVCFIAPLAVGGHIDHRVVQYAALEALAAEDAPPLAFYEDLPYSSRDGEAEMLPGLAASLDRNLSAAYAALPAEDVDGRVKRKIKMADCYDSQVDSDVVKGLAEFSRRYQGRERLWAPKTLDLAGLEFSTGEQDRS